MKKCKECGREEMGYGSLLDEDGYCFTCGITHSKEKIKQLQEQIYEANGIIEELYHLCHDKKKASSVVCDYLVRYGKTKEGKC